MLSALADGQLATEEMASANQHLASCPACTSRALSQFLLKSTTAKAGRQYAPSPEFQERIAKLASGRSGQDARHEQAGLHPRANVAKWGALAALLLVCIALGVLGGPWLRPARFATRDAALVAEVCDQHIAMMAAGLSPQVISTDRHTVKPWFQGKLPFSFNLPAALPTGMTLDGANLAYLGGQPAAQLLYSIGKHRASVFVRQFPDAETMHSLEAERSGFHVDGFTTGHVEMIAVSDGDPARLRDLVNALERAQ